MFKHAPWHRRAARTVRIAVLAMGVLFATGLVATPAVAADAPADVYTYLENPEMVGEGQEPPHAELRPYADAAAAQGRRRRRPPWTRSLDGDWKLNMSDRPEDVPAGFYARGLRHLGLAAREGAAHLADRRPRPPDVPQHPDRDRTRTTRRRSRATSTRPGRTCATFDVPADWARAAHVPALRGRDQRLLRLGQRPVRRLRPGRLHAGRVRRDAAPARAAGNTRRRAGAPLGLRRLPGGLRPVAVQRHLPLDVGCTPRRSTYLHDVDDHHRPRRARTGTRR